MAKVKKGQTMILAGFTGIKLTRVEVAEVTDKGIIVFKKDGTKMVFDKKTLVQTNAKNEKYAKCSNKCIINIFKSFYISK